MGDALKAGSVPLGRQVVCSLHPRTAGGFARWLVLDTFRGASARKRPSLMPGLLIPLGFLLLAGFASGRAWSLDPQRASRAT